MTDEHKTTDTVCAAELRGVTFSYNKQPFIEQLSATFVRDAVTSIVGPNGCGKSTLVKIIDGLLRPQEGEALVEGVPTLSLRAKERACRVAVLAQASRPPAMTVEMLVACGRHPHQAYPGRLSHEDHDCVDRALEMTGMLSFRKHEIQRLSGGERQRAFIAMTLAQDADIIVLDEPTTYLDIHACHETMQLVRQLHVDAGKTIVMVIHDLDLALRYSDYLLVMQQGRSVCAGSVADVLAAGAVEQAFGMTICPHETPAGRGYTLFPV